MISQRWMVGEENYKSWSFKINTQASTSGAKTTGIPFNTWYHSYYQPRVKIIIDWGDGHKEKLLSEDFSGPHDNSRVVHQYQNPGIYTVTVSCNDWKKLYFDNPTHQNTNVIYTSGLTSTGDYANHYYFAQTLIQVIDKIPDIGGSRFYDSYGSTRTLTNYVSALFNDCKHLTSIPSGLFANLTNVYEFTETFKNCIALTSIPADIFGNNINLKNLNNTFDGCTSLRSIPENIFYNCPNIEEFSGVFNSCTALSSIPKNLFKNSLAAKDFSGVFYKCTGISSIPVEIFANNTQAQYFQEAFGEMSITSIPANLFRYNTEALNFNATFARCTGITSIPENLFQYNTKALNFQATFKYTSITSIPANLFKYNTKVTTFGLGGSSGSYGDVGGCFEFCKSLTSIPANLFATNTEALYFVDCFAGCDRITSIPTNLFINNTKITRVNSCFSGCNTPTFSIRLKSPNITVAHYFVSTTNNIGDISQRIVYVPRNSDTENIFRAYASSDSTYYLKITVVSE